ncbi:MAG: DUF6502 family protein [Desulfuromonadales bacterium]
MLQNDALARTISRLLFPLVRLCLSNGCTFAVVEELLKEAFVQVANELQPEAPLHGAVSRISTATGLNRREVTRLIAADVPVRTTKPPLATEIFARWTTEQDYLDKDGLPSALKRQGPSPSFEALARSVTLDVHPRSMLAELVRLGLVNHDEEQDVVSLTRNEFVPSGDSRHMLDLLAANVGDHLDASVANVIRDGSSHLEQAVFADELSSESIEALRPLLKAQWQTLRDAMVPAILALIEADKNDGRTQDQRMRIGLYTYNERALNTENPASKPTGRVRSNSRQRSKLK